MSQSVVTVNGTLRNGITMNYEEQFKIRQKSNKIDFPFLVVCITSVSMAFGGVLERFQRDLASLFSSLYIIPQGRALESRNPADRPKEFSHNSLQRNRSPQDSAQINANRCSNLCFSLWDENFREGAILACRSLKAFSSIAVERSINSMFRAPTV